MLNIDLLFTQFLTANENKRLSEYRKLSAVYDYDKDEVEKILFQTFLNKPFSEETLRKMVFVHERVIDKILERKCAGLFSKDIIVEVRNNEGEWITINDWLNTFQFFLELYEVYKASKYFNTILIYANVINNEIKLERITGAECIVQPDESYYGINEIYLFRSDIEKKVFILYWSPFEVYKLYGNEKKYLEAFPDGINELGIIPISVLRDRKGIDFWGEPNWGLYYHQLIYVLNKSDNIRGELYQKFPILFGENINLENIRIEPSTLITAENKMPDVKLDLRYITPTTDWNNIRENEKFRNEQLSINEGLPASSTSLQAIQQSGYAKTIDEIELRERQLFDEWKLYYLIKDLIPKIVRLAEYFNILPDNVPKVITDVNIKFNPTKVYEEPSMIKMRREMEKEFLIKDEIDFIMEDLGLSEEEAIKYLQKRIERQDLINEYKNRLQQEITDEENSLTLVDRLKALL